MVKREIQSVEISCLIQSTEDGERVKNAIQKNLGVEGPPDRQVLEGHFGNEIVHMSWHLVGDDAWRSFVSFRDLLGESGREGLIRNLDDHLDEHATLFVRLNKQTLMGGLAVVSDADPVRIRIKPRGFMMKGPPEPFYRRLMEVDR